MSTVTIAGTFVLAFPHADPVDALARATMLSTAALGLLLRYLACPPAPGIGRAELAALYGLSLHALRRDNRELAEAGYLREIRRSVRGTWQHLLLVTDTPGSLPTAPQAWALLDASLAAAAATAPADAPEAAPAAEADMPPQRAHVPTSTAAASPQVATSAENAHIKPVNPFSSSSSPSDQEREPGPSVVATLAGLRRLATLPPLPAPEELSDLWLTPAQVLGLAEHYPARHADQALGVLAHHGLGFYLAPRVMALMAAGYTPGQISRTLVGIEAADHPAAAARWRLDRLLLAPAPAEVAQSWRPPAVATEAPQDTQAAAVRGAAAAREAMLRRGGAAADALARRRARAA
ncbi:hypothetical protein HNP84_007348 [Thermocatellispora tengchongensis]|uniref:Uncharacterized protein n=1 Tax=Thermocatellispora tengchongensis TaxID=1073253 RepID=A0A840PFP4_9ACTN|nr:hypothetical protein [Thermocatellispora tengchongensis]MBB5137596.1 hypothetical protein [Thermocatellispora tengchongensis]